MGKEIQPIKQQTSASAKRQKFDKAFKLNAVSLLRIMGSANLIFEV